MAKVFPGQREADTQAGDSPKESQTSTSKRSCAPPPGTMPEPMLALPDAPRTVSGVPIRVSDYDLRVESGQVAIGWRGRRGCEGWA